MFDSAIVEPVTDISDLFESFKQGGFIVVFSKPTGYARVAANVEDAGFEVRDCLHIQVGESPNGQPATHLLSVLARKPLIGTVAENVLAHGTGALNIDACRIGTEGGGTHCGNRDEVGKCKGHDNAGRSTSGATVHGDNTTAGRWPANTLLVHDWRCVDECFEGCPAPMLDSQSGVNSSNVRQPTGKGILDSGAGWNPNSMTDVTQRGFADAGGASRFFMNFRWAPSDTGLLPVSLLDYVERLISPVGGSVFRNV